MANKIKTTFLALLLLQVFCSYVFAQIRPASRCDNLDFRRGDFTGWVGRTSVYPANWPDANNCNAAGGPSMTCPAGPFRPGNTANTCNGCYSGGGTVPASAPALGPVAFYNNTGIVPGRQTIISTSVPDACACNNISTLPAGEPFCARLGNGGIGPWGNGVGYQIDYLSYTYLVSAGSSLLTYKYAVVLQDPLHDPSNPKHTSSIRPRFNVYIRDGSGNLIDPVCGKFEVVYDTTLVGFRECPLASIQGFGGNPYSAVGTAYRAWTTVGVDLRNYIGQNVTVEFNTWDCGWGGHFGYAYVSARCDSMAIQAQTCTPDGSVLLSAPDGFSYKWFPGGETTRDVKIINPNPGDSAYVELTTLNGCKTSVGTAMYPTVATADFKAVPTIACLKNAVVFKDSSSSHYTGNNSKIPIASWVWTFGDGTGSTLQSPSHTYTSAGTYTVNLTIVNQTGCADSLQKVIQVLPAPLANFTLNDVCVKSKANFTDASQIIGSTQLITNWLWTFKDDNSTTTVQNSSHVYNAPGTYAINLLVKTDQGCVDDTTMSIKIWPLPKANFSATEVCVGDSTLFADKSSPGDPNDVIVNRVWTFGDNSALSSDVNPVHIYLAAGTFKVQLITSTGKGCIKDTIISVIVHPAPKANFSMNTVCKGNPVSFKDLSTPATDITTWKWDFGDVTNNTSNLPSPTHVYDSSMVYYPSLVVSSKYGCIDSISLPIDIPPLPVVAFDANKYEGCSPLCVNFLDLSFSMPDVINKWSWTFGDGGTGNIKNPPYCYPDPGTYTVGLSVETANGCKSSLVWPAMIKVYPHPVADFIPDPTKTTISAPVITFTNKSSGATNWRWTFGDNDGALVKDTSHTYASAGTYTIWLYVVNQYGCVDSIAKDIVINPEWTFYVPNAFTPNNNLVNDGFIGYGSNIKDFEMWIFDRWGNMIYHCNDITKPWNGKVRNGAGGEKVAQQDVYVWKIGFRDEVDGKMHNFVGHVTLVR
jgi:gliding motility-associated-like protein